MKSRSKSKTLNLKGQLLLAMPGMEDPRFTRTVILICSHSSEGAMGFVLNQPVINPTFEAILKELKIDRESPDIEIPRDKVQVYKGGPVEQGRGFVLHSLDYSSPASARIGDLAAVTATLDALRHLSGPNPPQQARMMLGYSGWGEGQLEAEIAANGWLTLPATSKVVFDTHPAQQYSAALAQMGISEELLSASSGHA